MALTRQAALAVVVAVSTLQGCGVATNTHVVASRDARGAMITSVVPGATTEKDHVTRWGRPVAKVRQGAQMEYFYHDVAIAGAPFVIVTFQYGIAVGVRSSATERCRARLPRGPYREFAHTFDTVTLHGPCPSLVAGDDMGAGASDHGSGGNGRPAHCRDEDTSAKGRDCRPASGARAEAEATDVLPDEDVVEGFGIDPPDDGFLEDPNEATGDMAGASPPGAIMQPPVLTPPAGMTRSGASPRSEFEA